MPMPDMACSLLRISTRGHPRLMRRAAASAVVTPFFVQATLAAEPPCTLLMLNLLLSATRGRFLTTLFACASLA